MPQQPPNASELVPELGAYVGVSVIDHKIPPAFYLRWTLGVPSEFRARVIQRRDDAQDIVFGQTDQVGLSDAVAGNTQPPPAFPQPMGTIGQPSNDWTSFGTFDRPTLYGISARSGVGMSIDCFRYGGGYFFRLYVNDRNDRYDALVAHAAFLTLSATMQLIVLRRADEQVLKPLYILGPYQQPPPQERPVQRPDYL